jgi:hypothetical protein
MGSLLEALEDRTLLAVTMGSFDVVTTWPNGMPFQVQGWAFDADLGPNGRNPVTVRLDVDGFPVLAQQANVPRPDLVNVVGSAEHGYSFTLGPLAPGTHSLRVVAIDQPFGTEVPLGTKTATVQPGVFGVVESFDITKGVTGWAFDPVLSTASVLIRVDVDGRQVATQPANGVREDLVPFFGSANHGFRIALPQLSIGPHTVDVYGLPLTGPPTLLASFGASPPGPPFGHLDAADENIIGGWAADPDNLSVPTRVRIDIDGVTFQTLTTNIQRPDLVRVGPAPYGFQINTPLLGVGSHTVQVFVIDIPTGIAVPLGQNSFTLGPRPPFGSVDVINANAVITQIFGWAIDPDAPSQPVQVIVKVNGLQVVSGSASAERPDLLPVYGTSAHGYGVSFAPLSPGSHLVEVYALDLTTAMPALLKRQTVSVGF